MAAKKAGFDLAELDLADDGGADMTVCHPVTDKPLLDENNEPWTIRLCSAQSTRYEKAMHSVQNRRLKKRRMKITAEEIEAGTVEVLAKCVISWSGITLDGEKLDCSYQNAFTVFDRFKFIREQAADFMEDQANFLPS